VILSIVFWVSVVAALAASVAGLWRRSAGWAWLAAGLYLPLALYLFATPRFRWAGPLAWLGLAAAGWALRRGSRAVGLLLSAPAYALAGYLAWLVLNQPR
jgi:hypothetical protein